MLPQFRAAAGRILKSHSLRARAQAPWITRKIAPKLLYEDAREEAISHLLSLPDVETLDIQLLRTAWEATYTPPPNPLLDKLVVNTAETWRHIYLDVALKDYMALQQTMPRFNVATHLCFRFISAWSRIPSVNVLSPLVDSFPALTILEFLLDWGEEVQDSDPSSLLAPFLTPGRFSLQELRVGLLLLRNKPEQFSFLKQLVRLHATSLRALDVVPCVLHCRYAFVRRDYQDSTLASSILHYHATETLRNLIHLRVFAPQPGGDTDALCAFLRHSLGKLRSLRIFSHGYPSATYLDGVEPFAGLEHEQLTSLLRIFANGPCSLEQLDLPVQVLSVGLMGTLETCVSVEHLCIRFCFLGTAGSGRHDEVRDTRTSTHNAM